ncbi:hypothetical protein Scep_018965 [Stephania cephalantha]|uniref:Uncharacterized protein n=1 Tax=Stephania cephalantha TaxID=152367 RepID=A0AAP0NPC8_9MAGN
MSAMSFVKALHLDNCITSVSDLAKISNVFDQPKKVESIGSETGGMHWLVEHCLRCDMARCDWRRERGRRLECRHVAGTGDGREYEKTRAKMWLSPARILRLINVCWREENSNGRAQSKIWEFVCQASRERSRVAEEKKICVKDSENMGDSAARILR